MQRDPLLQQILDDEDPARRPAAPPTVDPNGDLRVVIRDDQAARETALGEAMRTAPAPDARAEAVRLADQYRLPVDLVERNLEAFRARAAGDLPYDQQLLRRAPKLAEWLTTSPSAPAARDDLETLVGLEHTLTFGGAILRGIDNVQGMTGRFLEATGEGLGAPGLTAYGRTLAEFNEAQSEALGPKTSVFALRGPWDLAQWLKETAGEQIPIMAPIVASGAAGAGIGSLIAPGIGTTIGGIIGAFIPSLVLGVGETQGTIKAIDPERAAPAAAFLGGTAIAALDTVLPGHVGSKLVRTFGRETAEQVAKRALLAPVQPRFVRSTVGGTALGMATEGLTEAFQEAIGAVAAAGATDTALPDDLWRQMVEAGAAGAVIGGPTEGGAVALTHRTNQAKYAAAEQQRAFFQALGQGAVDSKLMARLPQAAQEFLQQATKDGPVASLYAPVDTFVEYWQGKGVSPALIAEELTGQADALEQAQAAGTDLVIPTAAYAVKLAGTEHHAFFSNELRLGPKLWNIREARAASTRIAEAAEAAAAAPAADVQQNAVREQVYARVLGQALEAGARPDVANAWATLWSERLITRAARAGVDPLTLEAPRITSDVVSPVVVATDRPTSIPPSPATPGETAEQRARRRQAHLAALTAQVLRDARAIDPAVDEATIARELELRVALEEERQDLETESGRGVDLLRAMAGYGGAWWNPRTGGERGEIEHYALEGFDRREHRGGVRPSGPRTWNGVAGVFKEGGLPLDDMLTSLRQDQRFEHLETVSDLLTAIDEALRANQEIDQLPGTEELRDLGIVPGVAWWRDSWQPPAEDDVDESEPTDGGDDSFEFEQQDDLTPQEREAIRVFRERDPAMESTVRFAVALRDVGIAPPSRTAAEKRAANAYVDRLLAVARQTLVAPAPVEQRDADVDQLRSEYIQADMDRRAATTPADVPDNEAARAVEAERQADVAAFLDNRTTDGDGELYQLNERNTPPGFEVIAPWLTEDEQRRLRADTAQALVDVFEQLPRDADYEQAALAGSAKRGWYEQSTAAIRAVFGPVDSIRFTALLAALSPQTSVEQNLLNTVRMWRLWIEAGRPTARRRLQQLLQRSVAGTRGAESVLESWVDNVERALAPTDVTLITLAGPTTTQATLSGPKVQSFARNLWGYLQEVTNDAWMANFALIDVAVLGGNLQRQTDGQQLRGKGPGYLAFNAKIRRVAARLTRQTGETWTAAHVQETVWSWAKTLYELAEAEGDTAVEVLRSGRLTDAAIRRTPDFAGLFTKDADVRSILEAAGYGDVLRTLETAFDRRPRRRDGRARSGRAGARQQGRVVTPGLLRAARRLDALRQRRDAEAEAKNQQKLKAARAYAREKAKAARARARADRARRRFEALDDELYQRERDAAREALGDYAARDLFGMPRTIDTAAGTFASTTTLAETGRRRLGARALLTHQDAADAFAYLGKGAQERFDAIAVNSLGEPIGILGGFKGRVDEAKVYIDVLLGEAVRLTDVAGLWFAHNHPSGSPQLTAPDLALFSAIEAAFRDTGIETRGLLAMGSGGAYGVVDHTGTLFQGTYESASDRGPSVPILEREFATTGKLGPPLVSPEQAAQRVPVLAEGQFGLVYLDSKNQPIAFQRVAPRAAAKLRAAPGRLADLYRGLSLAGAASAIIYSPNVAHVAAAFNLANALRGKAEVLDIVVSTADGRVTSTRQIAPLALSGEFHQRTDGSLEGFYSRLAAAVARAPAARATGAQWKGIIRNSKTGINLDEYRAVAVDGLVDTSTYTREEVLAYLEQHQVVVEVVMLDEESDYTPEQLEARTERIYERLVDEQIEEIEESSFGPEMADYDELELEEELDDDGESLGWHAVHEDEHVGSGDTEEEAREEGRTWIDEENERRQELYDDGVREQARDGVEWSDAEEQARQELGDDEVDGQHLFDAYVEPGAIEGSYREVFLTAPKAYARRPVVTLELTDADRAFLLDFGGGEAQKVLTVEALLQKGEEAAAREMVAKALAYASEGLGESWLTRDMPAYAKYVERRDLWADIDANLTFRTVVRQEKWDDGHDGYAGIENPIVRIRFNVRTDGAGRRVLFLEEVQAPLEEAFATMPPIFQQHWRELAFKWALHEAAVNQYDALAWTSGAMQVTRYGLERVVDRLHWTRADGLGFRRVVADPRDTSRGVAIKFTVDGAGQVLASETRDGEQFVGHTLTEIVGKEIAEYILAAPEGELAQEGLRMGGRGLQRLYDVDFPVVVNKIPAVKKAGLKVGTVPLVRGELRLPYLFDADDATRQRMIAELAEAMRVVVQTEDVPGLPITPTLREQVLAGLALFQGNDDIKGGYNPTTNTIRLVAGKQDLSTFLHESGHAFLEELVGDALRAPADAGTPAQQQLVADATAVMRWVGFQGTLAEWRALPLEGRRAHHEQFARGFEAYLMEGKAPTPELRTVFAAFRRWLRNIYDSARALRVELTPEIRSVMDRLVASDEAIALAEAEAGITPLLTDPASAGVDPLTFAAYEKAVAEASLAAREEVDRRVMAEWRRERAAWWQQERDVVRAAVVAELSREPAFVAQSVIRTGRMPDGSIPPFGDGKPLKLSKSELVAHYGAAMLKRLPKPYLYVIDGGLAADTLAELVGFGSGDALLRALITTPRIDHIIENETDARMRAAHGDQLLEGMNLKEVAETAVHAHRAAVISAELRALTQGMAGAAIPRPEVINAQAEQRIRGIKVRDLKPGLYLQAARRASRQAFEAFAANDRAGAVAAKQQELVALAHYKAAQDAKERAVGRRRSLLRYVESTALRARIGKAGHDFLDQIDGFLERYEFTTVAKTVVDRRQSLRAWVERLREQNLPIDLPPSVLDDARRVNYQELTVDELEGVYEAVEQVAHLARLKTKLLKAAKQREFAAVVDELGTSIREHEAPREQPLESDLPGTRGRKLREDVSTAHLKLATIAREMDGFDYGPMWDYIIRPLNEAAAAKLALKAEHTAKVDALFDQAYTPADQRDFYRREHLPALGPASNPAASITKMGRLMVALNWGNETNRQRVRDGRGWNDTQVQAILDTLDRRDWQFVQAVWDYLETWRPLVGAKQRRVVGLEPEWVVPTPVFTRFGELKGGYFPIAFDGEQSAKAGSHEEASIAHIQQLAAYAAVTTRRSHVQRRAEGNVVRPVRLSFNVLFEHVEQVIHDLTHHEVLVDVGRLLGDPQVSQAILDTRGAEVYRTFKRTLRDVALGEQPARDGMERFVGNLRNGATVVGLAWNATTALLQPLGLTQSWSRIGGKWVLRGFLETLGSPTAMAAKLEWIYANSAFMRTRGANLNRELHDVARKLGLDADGKLHPGTWLDTTLRAITHNRVTARRVAALNFSLIQKAQLPVDMITWLGEYHRAMADPTNRNDGGTVDEARAFAMADQAVKDSQGSGDTMDLASVQRGSAYLKLLTNFYSYFNVTYQLAYLAKRQAGKRGLKPSTVAKLAGDYALLFVLPGVLGAVIRDAMRGEDEPEEYVKDAVLGALTAPLGTMVLLRELSGAAAGYAGYEGPAGLRAVAAISRFARQAGEAVVTMDPEAITESGLRALNTAAGALWHYPAGQVDKTVRGALALIEGTTSNPLALISGPPPAD